VTQPFARKLVILFAAGLLCTVGARPGHRPGLRGQPPARPETTVFLGGDMSDEERVVFTAAVAAAGHPGVVLFDTPKARLHLARFLREFDASDVRPVGRFDSDSEWSDKSPVALRRGRPGDLWRVLFPTAERVVVCPPAPRPLLLQAAALACAARAPLFVWHSDKDETELRDRLGDWKTSEILAVGNVAASCKALPDVRVRTFPDEKRTLSATLEFQARRGPVRVLVAANPADGGLSTLAPWVAAQKCAALLLTGPKGDDVRGLIETAIKRSSLRQADHLLILADRTAIPMEKRGNPLAGKDAEIEMEPFTPADATPFEFATGRMFDDDYGAVALQLARQRLLKPGGPRKALVVSNPGGGLPLLETLSRHSALELKNRGFDTATLFGQDVTKEDVRRRVPESDLFLWEGHHATLVKEYGFLEWDEPMKPSLVVLQSCLALSELTALPVLRRGSVAVIGSSTRTYSGSGGAFSLAFLDAMLYEDQTVGGALRQAKNFLLTYQLLKEKRLGAQARLTGANQRSSWAFTLWGDPTLKFPLPDQEKPDLAAVRHQVKRVAHHPDAEEEARKTHTITFELPDAAYDKVSTGKFQAKVRPNTRLAGLIRAGDDEGKSLVPFLFAEVPLPGAPAGKQPQLKGKVPDDHWVFAWDARRKVGYLLLLARAKDQGEIKFAVEWK
jgi:hypothetical protein